MTLLFFLSLLVLLIAPHSLYYRKLVLLKFALFYIFTYSLFLPQCCFHIVSLYLLCATVRILLLLLSVYDLFREIVAQLKWLMFS